MKTSDIVSAIRHDNSGGSGWVRRTNGGDTSKEELYILHFGQFNTWVRANGQWVSGHYYAGNNYRFGFRPGLIGRWRIRRAVKAWDRRRTRQDQRVDEGYDD